MREGDDVTVVAFGQMVGKAAEAIDSGNARRKLDSLVEFTQQCKPYIRKAL